MNDQQLDISALDRAVQRLDEGWGRYQQDVSDLQIRDGLIQRFEFTYEISHKLLKRYLAMISPTPALYAQIAFQELIRAGNEQGLLLGEWPAWRRYRDMRAKTSHTYDESIALAVVAEIPQFLLEARYLRDQLRERLQ
ncbi:nucleotidyltransferase substrate binding protein [Rhodopseudomonas palustris]|uniref:Nucleotidyltransferase substrate binding protein n=1 Tax=Thiospirillum jenense TaxID=1653858 RepID=A0A839HCR8_9GAMM|nr:HI0074 family nucleotidyltransferase substrate-binding subunit [Thiospirillum jenense]MBB1091968.1 nucleotidyltransferase substrate binding protein [Rhodopseudomonas palustris]MBB1126314.1 nucleotidyltransferase substrate binding protein [Thiospirillum jenense]